jgi:hypothetical protein
MTFFDLIESNPQLLRRYQLKRPRVRYGEKPKGALQKSTFDQNEAFYQP